MPLTYTIFFWLTVNNPTNPENGQLASVVTKSDGAQIAAWYQQIKLGRAKGQSNTTCYSCTKKICFCCVYFGSSRLFTFNPNHNLSIILTKVILLPELSTYCTRLRMWIIHSNHILATSLLKMNCFVQRWFSQWFHSHHNKTGKHFSTIQYEVHS